MQIQLASIASNTIPPLAPNDSVAYALKFMSKHAISSVIITNSNNNPIGIFTEHDAMKLLANGNHKENCVLSNVMTKDVFCVQADTHIHDGYILMEQKEYHHLIIVDKENKYVGMVSEGDFLRHLGFHELFNQQNIYDYMSKSILRVDENETVQAVAQRMSERKCEYSIVVKNNRPVSVINERDLALFYTNNKNVTNKSLKDLEQHTLHTITNNTLLQEASSTMKKHGVHQLIVVNPEGNMIGLITRHDILKAAHGTYFEFLVKTIEEKSAKEETLKRHQAELEKLVHYDYLTQLPNRLLFHTLLAKSASRALRNGHIGAVLLLDLDRFQDVNDSYGHSLGDELLVLISKKLQKRAREGDIVARLGGDEFAIILEELKNEEDASRVAQSIFKELKENFELSNGIRVSVNTSAGIVLIPKDSNSAEEILQYADSALNKAKKSGRSTYKFYTTEMTQLSKKKFEYELKIKKALKNGEFEMYYQPQVHIQTGKIIAAEALIRWKHPTDGFIFPNEFIPIAEESILINEIGNFVINSVCKQGKLFEDHGYHISLALNLSPNQLKYQNILHVLDSALQASGCSPQNLEIEITEGAIMHNVQQGLELLHAIKARGIKIAIDDFGTGYSSLAYLKQFPIDVLKIDKTFVDNLPYNKDDVAIAHAIIDMSKALGYAVLAEGVETLEQLNFLKEHECTLYQGYYKSKAIPASEFEELLKLQSNT